MAAAVSSSTRNLVQVSRPGVAAVSFTPGAVLHGICGLVVPHPPTSAVSRSLQNGVPLNTDYVPGILYASLQATIDGTWEVLVSMSHKPIAGTGQAQRCRSLIDPQTFICWKLNSSVRQGWEELGYGGRDLVNGLMTFLLGWDSYSERLYFLQSSMRLSPEVKEGPAWPLS